MTVVERIPAPVGEVDGPTRALIFDSYYDDYRWRDFIRAGG